VGIVTHIALTSAVMNVITLPLERIAFLPAAA
jgi:hypothetical protein